MGCLGEQHHNAKMTETTVREMRARHAGGESAYSLGKHYGITPTNAWQICRGMAWKQVKATQYVELGDEGA